MSRRTLTLVPAVCVVFALGVVAWLVLGGGGDDDGGSGSGAALDLDKGAVLTVGRSNAYPRAIAVSKDHGIVVAADSWNGRAWETALLRVDSDGRARETTRLPITDVVGLEFGDPGAGREVLTVLGRGKERTTLARVNADTGELDPSLGENGLLTLGEEPPSALDVGPNELLATADTRTDAGKVRVDGGPAITLPGETEPAHVVALGHDDKRRLYVGGELLGSGGADARPFLAISSGMNPDSISVAPEAPPGAHWKALAVHENGSATMVGDARVNGRAVITTARFNPDGTITPGSAAQVDSPDDAFTGGLAPAPGGGVYVASNSNGRTQLLHVQENGALDPQFKRPSVPGRAAALALGDHGSVILVTSVWVKSRQSVGLRRMQGLG